MHSTQAREGIGAQESAGNSTISRLGDRLVAHVYAAAYGAVGNYLTEMEGNLTRKNVGCIGRGDMNVVRPWEGKLRNGRGEATSVRWRRAAAAEGVLIGNSTSD